MSLSIETVPARILRSAYAVRGEIVTRASQLQAELLKNPSKFPFSEIVYCNIGNPQALGQSPLTFHRQVASALVSGNFENLSRDIKKRVLEFSKDTPVGAYSNSRGRNSLRNSIVNYITKRDGFKPQADSIYMTNGASQAISTLLDFLIDSEKDGILIPTPQYPLYSGCIVKKGGTCLNYHLEEESDWSLDFDEIHKNIKIFRKNGGKVRGFVLINPGNPTGSILARKDIFKVLKLCEKEKLVLFADEVYQDNVYDGTFISTRQVLLEEKMKTEVFSFHSISKGYYGECGMRGGYVQFENIDPQVQDQIYKVFSMELCSNSVGQILLASILNPPREGDESYEVFQKEKDKILGSLKRKAKLVYCRLNAIEGISCRRVAGAMYAFPKIEMPPKALEKAQKLKIPADLMYAQELLERTGILVVPGSGFGQKPNQYHLRMTILPQEDKFNRVLNDFENFHTDFLMRYK